MSSEILTPVLPESVADATVVTWHKKVGDAVKLDEVLVEVETDKVVLEVPASVAGVLAEISQPEGSTVTSGQLLGKIEAGAAAAPSAPAPVAAAPEAAPAAVATDAKAGPAARKAMDEAGVNRSDVNGSGKDGRILKEDVSAAKPATPVPAAAAPAPVAPKAPVVPVGERGENRVPMTRLRARIAERLLEAKQSTAMLTTFNEIDMQPIMDIRNEYKDAFEKKHGSRLGFMSIFVKAATIALQRFPEINAFIDGNDVVYHNYCDVGIAVSSERGLVVPVLRSAEHLGLADIEASIVNFAKKAKAGKLDMADLSGGTFTITNGGVFGSLMSTPILNPPQSAILGMHATQKRPVVVNDEIVIRPMMYVALSYDHRIVDGQGAVTFLKTIKELVENPVRIVLDV
ncbi:MAG: 2-oxoglutarate dehydrogenase complex dihydrolipoyllysine-residue succinyltransferase [Thiolinea sp.]